MRWRSGTAHLMPEDDADQRHRQLGARRPGYQLDGILLRALSSLGTGRMLTIRIDLDTSAVADTRNARETKAAPAGC
jgi:hypothetical protein